jgi:hypothetical protein
MLIQKETFVTATFDPRISAVHQVWHGFARSEQFRDATERVIAFVVKSRGSHARINFLVDARALGVLSSEDMTWAATNANPRLFAAGMRKIAFLVPEKAIARMTLQNYEKSARTVVVDQIESRQFPDLAGAERWLAAA